jgi:hypothetical protein
MLTPSLPLSRSLDLPVCFARFPADRLWLKDAVTRVKERPGFPSLEDSANLPDPDVIAQEIEIRSLPTLTYCYPRSFTFYVVHPIQAIVEDLQAALAQFAEWSEWDERHRR